MAKLRFASLKASAVTLQCWVRVRTATLVVVAARRRARDIANLRREKTELQSALRSERVVFKGREEELLREVAEAKEAAGALELHEATLLREIESISAALQEEQGKRLQVRAMLRPLT